MAKFTERNGVRSLPAPILYGTLAAAFPYAHSRYGTLAAAFPARTAGTECSPQHSPHPRERIWGQDRNETAFVPYLRTAFPRAHCRYGMLAAAFPPAAGTNLGAGTKRNGVRSLPAPILYGTLAAAFPHPRERIWGQDQNETAFVPYLRAARRRVPRAQSRYGTLAAAFPHPRTERNGVRSLPAQILYETLTAAFPPRTAGTERSPQRSLPAYSAPPRSIAAHEYR